MLLRKMTFVFLFLAVLSCNDGHVEKGGGRGHKSQCQVDDFIDTAMGGTFVGQVIRFYPSNGIDPHRILWLADMSGDTIAFNIMSAHTNVETQNVSEGKLAPGSCVSVEYAAEVTEEDGVVLDRAYTAKRLDYIE